MKKNKPETMAEAFEASYPWDELRQGEGAVWKRAMRGSFYAGVRKLLNGIDAHSKAERAAYLKAVRRESDEYERAALDEAMTRLRLVSAEPEWRDYVLSEEKRRKRRGEEEVRGR